MLKNLLLWEKWRPKKIEDCALPNRILNHFKDGLNKNYIFHGSFGTGKTTLARILIGRWSKDKAYLEINSSLYTSIDVLRSDIEKFCKTVPMFQSEDPIKYVFLDEFERVSAQYQDALKAFIEEYHHNVRFILTTNHFNKISDGIKSRMSSINFNIDDKEEEKEVKIKIFKRLIEITGEESIDIDKSDLKILINTKFPDIRSMLVSLQEYNGIDLLKSNVDNSLKESTYDIITNSKYDYNHIYHFLMNNYGADRIDYLFDILGREYVKYSIEREINSDKLFDLNFILSDYRDKLLTKADPIILGMTVIGKFRKILIN
jgi:DNA polymerase III delta prime subunit